jgi:hypothetical protein
VEDRKKKEKEREEIQKEKRQKKRQEGLTKGINQIRQGQGSRHSHHTDCRKKKKKEMASPVPSRATQNKEGAFIAIQWLVHGIGCV